MKSDHDLFIEFYEKYKNKLFTYLMYRLNFDRELSEDLLMDVVLKAYEKFDSYNHKKGSFKNWIFTITHNHLLNYWRDQSKKKTVDIESVQLVEEFKADDLVEIDNIQKILEIMKDSDAELILLKYVQGFSNKEIAGILNKKEGAVRTGLTRVVRQFKEIYKKLYNN